MGYSPKRSLYVLAVKTETVVHPSRPRRITHFSALFFLAPPTRERRTSRSRSKGILPRTRRLERWLRSEARPQSQPRRWRFRALPSALVPLGPSNPERRAFPPFLFLSLSRGPSLSLSSALAAFFRRKPVGARDPCRDTEKGAHYLCYSIFKSTTF